MFLGFTRLKTVFVVVDVVVVVVVVVVVFVVVVVVVVVITSFETKESFCDPLRSTNDLETSEKK